jgi:hypothetical protein
MTLFEQKNKIEQALKTCYEENEKIIYSVKDLCGYIDIEVYNEKNEEDLHVTNLIQKKINFFSKKVIEKIKESIENSENIEIKIDKDGIEKYEPIFYIYGSYIDEEKEKFKFKKSHLNSFIDNEDAFLIIIDLQSNYKFVPWKI